jgi:TPR repeat protein
MNILLSLFTIIMVKKGSILRTLMPEDNQKVPSQIFRWFEKMKSNYEQNVQSVLQRFEEYSHSQQLRIDQANQSTIDNLKLSHQKHLNQQNTQIRQLTDDVSYYKAQIANQQKIIEQLNSRYDGVMSCLLTEKSKDIDIKGFSDKDIQIDENIEFIEGLHLSSNNSELNSQFKQTNQKGIKTHINERGESTQQGSPSALEQCDDNLFDQAILKRQSGDVEQAFQLFKQAARLGHAKSMGAMGRSFFLGEGIEEDQTMGLAWLIHAANQALPQAIARVKYFQENNNELYQQAYTVSKQLSIA